MCEVGQVYPSHGITFILLQHMQITFTYIPLINEKNYGGKKTRIINRIFMQYSSVMFIILDQIVRAAFDRMSN